MKPVTIINLDRCKKSYARRKDLEAHLEKTGLATWDSASRIIIGRNSKGRWTAAFVLKASACDLVSAAHYGYLTCI